MEEQRQQTAYEKMLLSIYAYRLGAISFLELVALLEEVLGIEQTLDKREQEDEDIGRGEREG